MHWIKRTLIAFVAACLLAHPALAAFTVTSKGTNNASSAHSVTVSSLTIGSGTLVIVECALMANANGNAVSITDSASNSYTVSVQHYHTGGVQVAAIGYAVLGTSLSAGSVSCNDTTN